jgi:hypothetical protein
MTRKLLTNLLLALIALGAFTASAQAFGISEFSGSALGPDSQPLTQAAAHPDFTTTITFPKTESGLATANPKDVNVTLPPGLVGDPTSAPTCAQTELFGINHPGEESPECPVESQIGTATPLLCFFGTTCVPQEVGLYNMVAPPGTAGQFGFLFAGVPVLIDATVRSKDGQYSVGADVTRISQAAVTAATAITFWGVPSDPSHDAQRRQRGSNFEVGAHSSAPRLPLMRNPTFCTSTPLTTSAEADSWQEPGIFHAASFDHDPNGNPMAFDGCESVPFSASFAAHPTTGQADSPSGLDVDITIPQPQNPDGLSTADLKKAVVTLPEGMVVNPSSADGLGSCQVAQIKLDSDEPATCPESSKIGAVEIITPLLEHPLSGAVYLAKQKENKFGSLLAIYLAVDDPATGVVLKLPGQIETTATGQVTASFDENPQLPFEELHVELFGGPRASLMTPPACGSYSTQGTFTPWSGTPPVSSTSSFQITTGPNGSPCPNGGFAPKLSAGTTNPVAGALSPFVLHLTREDGTQRLGSLGVTLPKGLLATLKGVPYCPNSVLAGIPSAEGTAAAQVASPSCPAASQVGTVSVGAGAGPSPFYVNTGRAYLAGPYKGAPLSLAVVTPALAGPFDLGNVVVRNALQVNPETTQVTAVSDPLPTILDGIPLDLRDVTVNLDRPSFTVNPTNCDPTSIAGSATSAGGTVAAISDRFQAANCAALGFGPKLALSLKGGTTRAKNPALKAVLTAPAGQANIGKVQTILPKSVFIDSRHVNNPCTRVQFNEGAGNGSACPAKSILGKATAYSPLLGKPLTGNVYFRSNGGERKLPDLVASLDGQIHVNLVGFIDSVKQKGKEGSRVRNTFASVPDAPVSRFVLELQGGKKGLLQNSTNLCKSTNKATVKMDGQNGKVHDFETVVRPSCSKPRKKGKGK